MTSANINPLCIGLDVGSTTVKIVIFDSITHQIYVAEYQRHYTEVFQTLTNLMRQHLTNLHDRNFTVTVTGSAGIGIAESLQLPFVQEVIACMEAVTVFIPQTNTVIELGGEDAKIMFFDGSIDLRMNETCAGGTGAFIDQIAVALKTDAAGINELASRHQKIYSIATRCGVFTKSDVTMLFNEGAKREDVAASVLQAIVEQTIGGLACGRKIRGNVAFLGGPLHFLPELRRLFIETLKLTPEQAIVPDKAHFFVALGAALLSAENREMLSATEILQFINNAAQKTGPRVSVLDPLFATREEYEQFQNRHAQLKAEYAELSQADGDIFLGIDAGSTTTKAVLIDEDHRILRSWYGSNEGNPVQTVRNILKEIDADLPATAILRNSCVTGYGEYLLQAAFGIDRSEVETLAHYRAARFLYRRFRFDKGVKRIFYPALPVERREFKESLYSYSCPVVGSYPEVIRLNVDEIKEQGIDFIQPFLPGDDAVKLAKLLYTDLKKYGVNYYKLMQAAQKAFAAQIQYEEDIRQRGEELVNELLATGQPAVVLAGHPYHLDPMIHHGIPELINSLGVTVLSGDSVAHLGKELLFPLNVVDQWRYHARLYRAATFTAKNKQFQMVQLTSFGCGLDAVVAEQVAEILHSVGKPHTLLKIDEGTQLGAVKIRIRSLLSTIPQKQSNSCSVAPYTLQALR